MHKIYAEVIFLDNFIIDLLILMFAALLTRSKLRVGRYVISAAVGGIYASAAYGIALLENAGIKLAVGAAICLIAYRVKGERGFWKNTCAFLVTAFIFAGAVYAVTGLSGQKGIHGILMRPQAGDIILGIGTGSCLAAVFCIVRKKVLRQESGKIDLTLDYGKRRITVRALVDTGNLLTEPLSGLDVIIVSRAAAKALFGKDIDYITLQGKGSTERLRAVPYTSASGEGVMFGLEVDKASLRGNKSSVKAVVCVPGVPLVYEAIAGAALTEKLSGGKEYGKVSVEQSGGMAVGSLESGGADRLYKRQRRSSAAADPAGGIGTYGGAGRGR